MRGRVFFFALALMGLTAVWYEPSRRFRLSEQSSLGGT